MQQQKQLYSHIELNQNQKNKKIKKRRQQLK